MKIELLHITECPSWGPALRNLKHALIDLELDNEIEVRRVDSGNLGEFPRFQGSPTILVNGIDIFPVDDFDGALSCRVYQTPEGPRGLPTQQQIIERMTNEMKRG